MKKKLYATQFKHILQQDKIFIFLNFYQALLHDISY
jgi:hypothetical protein